MVGRFNVGSLLLWRALTLASERVQSILPAQMGKVRPDGVEALDAVRDGGRPQLARDPVECYHVATLSQRSGKQ